MGSLAKLNGFCYQTNPDTEINQHGRKLLNICKLNNFIPLI